MGLISETLNSLANKKDPGKCFVSAVILAGGSGERMHSPVTKQMLDLGGVPVIVRTLLAFEKSEFIKEIIVSAREDEMIYYKRFADGYSLGKLRAVVKGGATRQDSVTNALRKISPESEYIAIHDGARPLVTEKNIEDVVRAAVKYGCACAGCRAKDTVKTVGVSGFIETTPERGRVWYASTPQVFKAELYRAASFYAARDGFVGTDDSSLTERIGFYPKMVDCGYENIKITTPEDLTFARIIIEKRQRQ